MDGITMVGQNVRRFRQERQLSLGGLAQAAGLAKQTLANLENGSGNPTIETLFAVSRALGVGVTWLLTEWGTPVYVQRGADAEWSEELPALSSGALHHTYVLQGTLMAGPAGQETTLREGDFIRFPGDVRHVLRAMSGKAVAHIVTTVPQVRQFSS